MTEFRYGDEVWWQHTGADEFLRAVVVDERKWGGVSAGGGVGVSPEFARVADYPVFIRVAEHPEPRWVSGRELVLIRPRVDED